MESATTSSQLVRRSTERRREIITWLLGILSVLLTLSLIVGGVFTRLELAARRSLAQNLQAQQVDSLTQANLELQDSVNALLAERDNLSQQVNQLEATKADQAQQIEKLTAKTEELQKKPEALQKENSKLSQQVRGLLPGKGAPHTLAESRPDHPSDRGTGYDVLLYSRHSVRPQRYPRSPVAGTGKRVAHDGPRAPRVRGQNDKRLRCLLRSEQMKREIDRILLLNVGRPTNGSEMDRPAYSLCEKRSPIMSSSSAHSAAIVKPGVWTSSRNMRN